MITMGFKGLNQPRCHFGAL